MLIKVLYLLWYSMNKICVFQVKVGEESTGRQESPATVVLQIESASVAAVCGLHHAVLRRLQVHACTHTDMKRRVIETDSHF